MSPIYPFISFLVDGFILPSLVLPSHPHVGTYSNISYGIIFLVWGQ